MQRIFRVLFPFWAVFAAFALMPVNIQAQAVGDPLDQPAQKTPRAAKSVLLDITMAGTRLVRGRRAWNCGAFGRRRQDVASGKCADQRVPHCGDIPEFQSGLGRRPLGVVLHSEDGGETWSRQLDGKMAAQLAIESAQADAAHDSSPNARQAMADAERLVADGPDKPFLAVYFENEQVGFIVGAYGLIFRTEDGGKTWKSWMDKLENPKGLHINTMKAAGDNLYLAGEQGLFLRSSDKGQKFHASGDAL